MRVGTIRNLIVDMSDDEEVIALWYDKSDANDYVYNNMGDGENQPEITNTEWIETVHEVEKDEGVWQEISEAFNYQMNKIEQARIKAKGETNDNSNGTNQSTEQ
jgi:hypothetical protein